MSIQFQFLPTQEGQATAGTSAVRNKAEDLSTPLWLLEKKVFELVFD